MQYYVLITLSQVCRYVFSQALPRYPIINSPPNIKTWLDCNFDCILWNRVRFKWSWGLWLHWTSVWMFVQMKGRACFSPLPWHSLTWPSLSGNHTPPTNKSNQKYFNHSYIMNPFKKMFSENVDLINSLIEIGWKGQKVFSYFSRILFNFQHYCIWFCASVTFEWLTEFIYIW